jgi:hypothetical protein
MTGIDDWDRVALRVVANAPDGVLSSPAELVEGVGVDQFDEAMARAWIEDALSRQLIRRIERPGPDAFEIADKGRGRADQAPSTTNR